MFVIQPYVSEKGLILISIIYLILKLNLNGRKLYFDSYKAGM